MTDYSASGRSPSELERDAERMRARVADTAEHLKEKMSPGQLMDEVVDYFKDGDTNQLLSNLKRQVRDNPLALAMVGGGIAWLMMGTGPSMKSHHTGRGQARASVRPTAGEFGGSPGTLGSTDFASSGPASSASVSPSRGSSLSKGADAVREKGSAAVASVSGAATSAADAVSATAHDLRDAASDYMSNASQAGADMGARAKSTVLDAIEREPLVLGAIGVAVGAAIGAMLPASRAEGEYLGEVGRTARDAAETAVSEGVDKAKHVASDVYNAAKDEADRQGLVPHGKPLTEKARDVAKAAGDELKSASDEMMDRADRAIDRTTDRMPPGKDRPM